MGACKEPFPMRYDLKEYSVSGRNREKHEKHEKHTDMHEGMSVGA